MKNIYLIKAKGPETTYIAVQLHSTNKQYTRLLTGATIKCSIQQNVNVTESRNSLQIIDFTTSS